jgi:hypothetical protein
VIDEMREQVEYLRLDGDVPLFDHASTASPEEKWRQA